MKKLNRKYLFIILAVVVAFLLPFFAQNKSSITYATGETCSADGRSGICRDRSTTSCSTYYRSGVCPGGTNNQCCITNTVHCDPDSTGPIPTGTCHNSSGGNTYNCIQQAGKWYSGVCPGPADVQCCVLPTPTNTPTPTLTPTATPTPTPTPTPIPSQSGSSTTTPGIIFTGNGSADFGSGQASTKGWVVGGPEGTSYPEVFSQSINPSPLSYQRLLDKAKRAKLPRIDMTTLEGCVSLDNCTLPTGLQNGIYQAIGNVTLNGHTFDGDRDYVFLIEGDLKIIGNIITTNGSTVLFSSSNDITIDKTVGAAANSYPLPTAQIQAMFNADGSFILDGTSDCSIATDKMLNFEGAIVTNSGIGKAGTLRNFRDLCSFNATIPSFTIRHRLDFILNAPEFIMTTSTTFREAP